MIGRELVKLLIEDGVSVRTASLDSLPIAHPKVEFFKVDLTLLENCRLVCRDMDYVFNLLGVKGSVGIKNQVANLISPMLQFDTNLLRAVQETEIDGYLLTSSYGVYYPAEISKEDDVWNTPLPPNDRFAGMAKRTAEMELEAHRIQYGWKNTAIVRPSNVYGPYDNFDSLNAMVVPSIIKRAANGENPLVIWGDGSQVRDFIHAKDAARGILIAAKNSAPCINLGSGTGTTIKHLAETIVKYSPHKTKLIFDSSKPIGDKMRILDISKAKNIGFQPEISLEEGLKETVEWYLKNKDKTDRYDVFEKNRKTS